MISDLISTGSTLGLIIADVDEVEAIGDATTAVVEDVDEEAVLEVRVPVDV